MSMVAFFPWLILEGALQVEEFTLIPYQRGRRPAGTDEGVLDVFEAVTRPYVVTGDRPIQHTTFVKTGNGTVTRDLSEKEVQEVFSLTEALALSALSRRSYFQSGLLHEGYWSRDNFHLVVQEYTDSPAGATITTRRRDGYRRVLCGQKFYRVHLPEHVDSNVKVQIDIPLLKSLMGIRGLESWSRIWESIVGFNLANTDDMKMPEHLEAVLLVGAFQRLLGCKSDADDLTTALGKVLVPAQVLPAAGCARLSEPSYHARFKKDASVREAWIRDFYISRHGPAHGALSHGYKAAWSLREHLLLGSFVFPLLVKSVLATDGTYTMTDDDRFKINLFETLASESLFPADVDGADPDAHPWRRVWKEGGIQRAADIMMGPEYRRRQRLEEEGRT